MSMVSGSRSVGRLRRLVPVVLVVGLLAVVVAVAGTRQTADPLARIAAWHATATTAGSGATPRLGAAEAVEYDDVGDPSVLSVPGGVPGNRSERYVLFWTTDWRSNVPTAVSPDHVHWTRVADALPVLPSWATPSRTMTWGPSAQRVRGGYDLYFSTLDASNRLECVGVASSTSPVGPYVDRSPGPLVCQHDIGGDIDPSVVHLRGGGSALVWKNNGNAVGRLVSLWEQRLTPSGLALTGSLHHLIAARQKWEHGNIEGPAMLADTHGGWWLFYTGGSWLTDTYDTAVSWCATVSGPCRPTRDGPLLTGTSTAVSPGGLDTFVDGHGRLWASFSVFPGRPANGRAAEGEDRVLEVAPVVSH